MNTYTIFIGSAYWKSYTNKKIAKTEATRLKNDGAQRVRTHQGVTE